MSEGTERVHYVDWLRVLAVLLLFPFHTLRVYNAADPFYVKAGVLSSGVNVLIAYIDRWHMPLLFLLAGASTFLALRKRSTGAYVRERSMRLLVPLLFGLLLIIPPQTYLGGRFNSGYSGSYMHYLLSGDFLAWNIQDGGDYYGGFGIGHLWFILWLLMVSILALPLVAWVRGDKGRAWLGRWGRRLSRPVWWLLPPLLIWVGDGLPDIAGKNPFYYLMFFVLGMAAMADAGFGVTAERHRWTTIALGTAITFAYTLSWRWRDAFPDPSLPRMAADYAGFLGTWLVLVGLIGLGRRHLDTGSPQLSYLAESSYPVYILHQTVIVVLAAAIVTLPLIWTAQWMLLLVAAVAVTFGIYELARRIPAARFLLGMKHRAA